MHYGQIAIFRKSPYVKSTGENVSGKRRKKMIAKKSEFRIYRDITFQSMSKIKLRTCAVLLSFSLLFYAVRFAITLFYITDTSSSREAPSVVR